MFDFFSGFLLGILFTLGMIVFGIYKLLLRQGNDRSNDKHLPHYPSLTQLHKYVKHSIPKHNADDAEVNLESCKWLNNIMAALCVEALSSPLLVENLHKKLHDILNKQEDKPDILGKIVISDINMGTRLPQVDGVRVLSNAQQDTLTTEVAIRYDGGASFTINTELWVNWPTPKFASLPFALHASFEHFEGILATTTKWYSDKALVTASFPDAPLFEIRIGSTIGHTTKLVNVQQVSEMIKNMIYSFVRKELVRPGGFEFELEGGKVIAVRKMGNTITTQKITAGEGKGSIQGGGGKEVKFGGDLSQRSFSVSNET